VSDRGLSFLSVAEIIRLPDLSPLPEGRYFRETFRDSQPDRDRSHQRISCPNESIGWTPFTARLSCIGDVRNPVAT